MSRRGSTTAQVNLAKPFQIWHESESTGKHIEGECLSPYCMLSYLFMEWNGMVFAGSKKKLRWRFGWSDSDAEHEVDFHHTITSGKKVTFKKMGTLALPP